jgi:DNA-binding transcriptional MerR regulator
LDKSPDAFRTISEAADELDLPQHVLRFWETRFSTIKPLKRGGGRRYYRPEDVLLLKGIRHLLYDQGFTIKGVQRILKDQGIRAVIAIGDGKSLESLPPPSADDEDVGTDQVDRVEFAAQAHQFDPDDSPRPVSRSGLDASDRDKLSNVLRDLLDAKRLLERAREG